MVARKEWGEGEGTKRKSDRRRWRGRGKEGKGQFWFKLLMFESTFKGVSQCVPPVVCFTLVSSIPSNTLPHPFREVGF
jgi:hypothetical protein